jgi:hypothetical protein
MKKIKCSVNVLLLMLLLMIAGEAFGVEGSCTQTTTENILTGARRIYLVCTGNSGTGALPNTALSTTNANWISGWRLEQVDAYPTPSGTAPDAADVFILDAHSKDLLGSIDNSTAYGGLNLIHATLTKSTPPFEYCTGNGLYYAYTPIITGGLTLKVSNQATNSANYTIVLTFYK